LYGRLPITADDQVDLDQVRARPGCGGRELRGDCRVGTDLACGMRRDLLRQLGNAQRARVSSRSFCRSAVCPRAASVSIASA
jgi:hypothetical protein